MTAIGHNLKPSNRYRSKLSEGAASTHPILASLTIELSFFLPCAVWQFIFSFILASTLNENTENTLNNQAITTIYDLAPKR
jgi:hypothetical protein